MFETLHDPARVPRGYYDGYILAIGGSVDDATIDRDSWGRTPEAIANHEAMKSLSRRAKGERSRRGKPADNADADTNPPVLADETPLESSYDLPDARPSR